MVLRSPTIAMPPRVKFHYIKSNAHRVIHVDGVIGGPTPNGHIHASLFSERIPIPTAVEHETEVIEKDGQSVLKLGAEASHEGKAGFVREVEMGVVLTANMARKLRHWLKQNLEIMGEATEVEDEKEGAADES